MTQLQRQNHRSNKKKYHWFPVVVWRKEQEEQREFLGW